MAKSKTSLTHSSSELTGGGTLRGSVTCFFPFRGKGACHARMHDETSSSTSDLHNPEGIVAPKNWGGDPLFFEGESYDPSKKRGDPPHHWQLCQPTFQSTVPATSANWRSRTSIGRNGMRCFAGCSTTSSVVRLHPEVAEDPRLTSSIHPDGGCTQSVSSRTDWGHSPPPQADWRIACLIAPK